MTPKSIKAGSKITVRMDGFEKYLTISDTEYTDVENGHVSFNSSIAQALIGAEKGDVSDIELPNGEHVNLEVVSVD